MSKQELIKKYREIVMKTNGGNDDYVVALCKIANAINELEDTSELQRQLKVSEKAIKLAVEEIEECVSQFCPYMIYDSSDCEKTCHECRIDYFKQLAEKEVENDNKNI